VRGLLSLASPAVAGVSLDDALSLDPQVALRPEPFGALAYHYGNRRLIFLKHPDVVAVVKALDGASSLRGALESCGVAESRWPSFVTAIGGLVSSEVVRVRAVAG
jgi:mycofactocin biosynthesis protein MftB